MRTDGVQPQRRDFLPIVALSHFSETQRTGNPFKPPQPFAAHCALNALSTTAFAPQREQTALVQGREGFWRGKLWSH